MNIAGAHLSKTGVSHACVFARGKESVLIMNEGRQGFDPREREANAGDASRV